MGEDWAEDAEVARGQGGAANDGGLVELDNLGAAPSVQPHPQARAGLLLADLPRDVSSGCGSRFRGERRGGLIGLPCPGGGRCGWKSRRHTGLGEGGEAARGSGPLGGG